MCGRRGWRAGDARGVWSLGTPFGGEGGEECAYLLLRVGACADELRLMGVERGSISARVAGAVVDRASFARNASSACAPSAIERMWRGPCGEGAKCTMQSVAKGGRRRARRCALSRRFAVTKGCSEEGTWSSRLVIDTISKPSRYCSRAATKVHVSGPHRTRNSSTHGDRRSCLIRMGSERANMYVWPLYHRGIVAPESFHRVAGLSFLARTTWWDVEGYLCCPR